MSEIALIGAGGVGRSVIQLLENSYDSYDPVLFDDSMKESEYIHDVPVRGSIDDLRSYEIDEVCISIGDPETRKSIKDTLESHENEYSYPNIISDAAFVPDTVTFGKGNIVYPGVVLDPDIQVNHFCLINKNTTIGHDCEIRDAVTVSPGVNIGGNTELGEMSYIGINSTILESVQVDSAAIIGGGAVVVDDVKPNTTVVGVPASAKDF